MLCHYPNTFITTPHLVWCNDLEALLVSLHSFIEFVVFCVKDATWIDSDEHFMIVQSTYHWPLRHIMFLVRDWLNERPSLPCFLKFYRPYLFLSGFEQAICSTFLGLQSFYSLRVRIAYLTKTPNLIFHAFEKYRFLSLLSSSDQVYVLKPTSKEVLYTESLIKFFLLSS